MLDTVRQESQWSKDRQSVWNHRSLQDCRDSEWSKDKTGGFLYLCYFQNIRRWKPTFTSRQDSEPDLSYLGHRAAALLLLLLFKNYWVTGSDVITNARSVFCLKTAPEAEGDHHFLQGSEGRVMSALFTLLRLPSHAAHHFSLQLWQTYNAFCRVWPQEKIVECDGLHTIARVQAADNHQTNINRDVLKLFSDRKQAPN